MRVAVHRGDGGRTGQRAREARKHVRLGHVGMNQVDVEIADNLDGGLNRTPRRIVVHPGDEDSDA